MLFRWLLLSCCAVWFSGCAGVPVHSVGTTRPFDFSKDTFAYANELVWEYPVDPVTGQASPRRREPKADYTLHCFVVARSAKQFSLHAKFNAGLARTNEATYRRLVEQVLARSPRSASADAERVVIPGFAGLREFSGAHERTLKSACGGAWQSYVQRGHWRMLFPFTRHHQERAAGRLREELRNQPTAVVHVVRFPALTINHAMLLFDVAETEREILFTAYDPNSPDGPVKLKFDRRTRRFSLPRNLYFAGGRVDVYEVYRDLLF